MKSQWYELKDTAILLRKDGQSLKTINKNLGVPVSTLSGWFKNIELSDIHKLQLQKNNKESLIRARVKAAEWHHTQKRLRLHKAKQEAKNTLDKINVYDNSILDLAFAMLYLGEGKKSNTTAIANSNPIVLRFVLTVLKRNYHINPDKIRCELHLRADQDSKELIDYWSQELSIPVECFKSVFFDKRSQGRPTYSHYKGVCVLNCGQIAIQRKLMYLYTLFCEKIAEVDKSSGT